MSYGIQVKNTQGDLVLDEENEVVVVAQKGTVSGTRTSVPGSPPSLNNDFEGKWWYNENTQSYITTIVLDQSYDIAPILAVRGGSGTQGVRTPLARVYRHDGTSYNRIRMISEAPSTIDYILCTNASAAPTSSRDIGTDEYGLEIKNSSAEVIFDSRWPSIVACIDSYIFPDLSFTTTGSWELYNLNTYPNIQTQTIPSTPGCFMAVSGLSGFKRFYTIDRNEEPGAPAFYIGGGEFVPSLRQTSDTSITLTANKINLGPITTSQSQVGDALGDNSLFNGYYLILRHLDF